MHWQGDSMYGGGNLKPFKERGGCLLIWLIFLIGTSILTTLRIMIEGPEYIINDIGEMLATEPPSWYVPMTIITNVATIACGVAMWMWKKWGFYGYILIQVAWFVAMLPFADGLLIIASVFGLAIAAGIAWFVVTPYWEDME